MTNTNKSWQLVHSFSGHESWIYGVPITPGNKLLASVNHNDIAIWNLELEDVDSILEGHQDIIFSLCINSSGTILASGSLDKTIRLWSLDNLECIGELQIRKDPIHSVCFSPDSNLLAAGGENKYKSATGKNTCIYIYEVSTQKAYKVLQGHDLRVNSIAFNDDGCLLASGSNDGTVRLWDVQSGKQIHVLKKHAEKVSTVAFGQDGKLLFSAGDGGINIWEVETGKHLKVISKDIEYIPCLAIHPKESWIAFGGDDKIQIWDFEQNEIIESLDSEWNQSLSFSSDGQFLSSGDASAFASEEGGLVKIWQFSGGDKTISHSPIENLEDIREEIEDNGGFETATEEDAKKRIIASIVQRQGQSEFRQALLCAYKRKCPITGCDVESALEAAHITPYNGIATNHVQNGLLLRADIHTIFDLYLLSVDPEKLCIVISPNLEGTCYSDLADKKLDIPEDTEKQPSLDALFKHYELFNEKLA